MDVIDFALWKYPILCSASDWLAVISRTEREPILLWLKIFNSVAINLQAFLLNESYAKMQ